MSVWSRMTFLEVLFAQESISCTYRSIARRNLNFWVDFHPKIPPKYRWKSWKYGLKVHENPRRVSKLAENFSNCITHEYIVFGEFEHDCSTLSCQASTQFLLKKLLFRSTCTHTRKLCPNFGKKSRESQKKMFFTQNLF